MGEDFTRNEQSLGKGWGDVERVVDEKSKGNYVKLEDGKSMLLTVIGDPEAFETTFPGADKPSTRVRVDVFSLSDKKLLTWEMSRSTWDALKRQKMRRASDQEFRDSVFELGRQGTELNTKYFLEYVRMLKPEEKEIRDGLHTPF